MTSEECYCSKAPKRVHYCAEWCAQCNKCDVCCRCYESNSKKGEDLE